ncbi:MAG: hypothetical protein ABR534_04235 [Desulfotignum sp.]|nr:hypothetical protein [Desulfobacteraceae bacterium]
MKTIQVVITTILAAFLFTACGTATVDSIHPVVRTANLGNEKTIVILPFADYTPADSPVGYWRRNMLIMEALQDEILRFGYAPAVSEDVISYLSQKKIINQNTVPELSSANTVLQAELAKDWSDIMKSEIAKVLHANLQKQNLETSHDPDAQYKSIALDHNAIQEIGMAFNADYVVRGRIIVFKNGREDSFNPLQTGVLPFFFNTGSRALFGIAESENYEMIDKMAIGGILGAAVSMNDWPVDSDTTTSLGGGHPRFGGGLITETSYSDWNTAIWGVAGAGLAHLAHKGGRVDNAVVQLRMIVQNTRNGEIVWTNRAEVKTMTQSAFNKKDGDVLMARAIQQVCERLFDNFVASDADRRVVRMYDDGTFYVTPAGGLKAHSNPLDPIHIESPAAVSKDRKTFKPLSETRDPVKTAVER